MGLIVHVCTPSRSAAEVSHKEPPFILYAVAEKPMGPEDGDEKDHQSYHREVACHMGPS